VSAAGSMAYLLFSEVFSRGAVAQFVQHKESFYGAAVPLKAADRSVGLLDGLTAVSTSDGKLAKSTLALEFSRTLSKTVLVDAATIATGILLVATAISHLIADFELLWMGLLQLRCLKILELRKPFASARLFFLAVLVGSGTQLSGSRLRGRAVGAKALE
jgi:hypothetical protein